MDALILKNVRCFGDLPPIPLAPLTLLVGENSTGKSTFLGAVKMAAELRDFWRNELSFNKPPFFWGAFEQIIRRNDKSSFEDNFTIGSEFPVDAVLNGGSGKFPVNNAIVLGSFVNSQSQPALHEWSLKCGSARLRVAKGDGGEPSLRLELGLRYIDLPLPDFGIDLRRIDLQQSIPWIMRALRDSQPQELKSSKNSEIAHAKALVNAMEPFPSPRAFAPIRSEPARAYFVFKDITDATGSHVPVVLWKSFHKKKVEPWIRVLNDFGSASGLFDSIEVEQPGSDESNPFQVIVRFATTRVNIVDVGYGVSQILPVVVEILREQAGTLFLLQQPEVHLHPRAQAEFATLLGQLVKADKKQFIVETHSDYIIDRVRMDVRDGTIRPSDVIILYFERDRKEAHIHPIKLDSMGNLVDAPSSYRRFFLDEERRFLGIK